MFEGEWAKAACVVSTEEGLQPGFYFEDGGGVLGLQPQLFVMDRRNLYRMIDEATEGAAKPGLVGTLVSGLAEALLMLGTACRNARCPKVKYLVQVDGRWAKARYAEGELVVEPV